MDNYVQESALKREHPKETIPSKVTELAFLLFSCLVMSDYLQPHGLQHARLPCPLPSPRACSNSCSLSWWCHPTISSSVVPFSSHPLSEGPTSNQCFITWCWIHYFVWSLILLTARCRYKQYLSIYLIELLYQMRWYMLRHIIKNKVNYYLFHCFIRLSLPDQRKCHYN